MLVEAEVGLGRDEDERDAVAEVSDFGIPLWGVKGGGRVSSRTARVAGMEVWRECGCEADATAASPSELVGDSLLPGKPGATRTKMNRKVTAHCEVEPVPKATSCPTRRTTQPDLAPPQRSPFAPPHPSPLSPSHEQDSPYPQCSPSWPARPR